MDYKEKYEQAMLRMNKWVEGSEIIEPKEVAKFVFPELKESEDEKIRKTLVELVKCNERSGYKSFNNVSTSSMIAWLEKQSKVPVTIDINKMVGDYANNNERDNENFGKPVACMIRAYRQGLNDAISILNFEKQVKQETLCDKCRKEQPSHSCQDITALGRCAVEHEKKSAWSEEDENMFNDIIMCLKGNFKSDKSMINWLKSFKQRMKGE